MVMVLTADDLFSDSPRAKRRRRRAAQLVVAGFDRFERNIEREMLGLPLKGRRMEK